jgi:hypothetical protein
MKLAVTIKILTAILAGAGVAAAQTQGILRGVLTDTSGAVIPSAPVVLTAGDKTQRSSTTQADGSYTFAGLAPGPYTVHVEFPGFTPFDRSVTIEAGRTLPFPIRLALETAKQEVTVADDNSTSAGLSVDPSQTATTTVIAGADLDALPDNPDDLASMLTALAGPSAGPAGGGQILLDGFSGGQLPPKESIKEIRMDSNPFSAQYDSMGFGRIEIITKPGGGNLRGGIGLNDSDAYFNSRNPYALNKADYVNRMLTSNLAGPIGKRVSYTLNLNRSIVNNSALINAVTLDPKSLVSVPVQSTVTTPQTVYEASARIDAQLSTNNTLMGRYQRNLSDRENNGIGQYSLVSRAYSSQFSRHETQLTESWVANPTTIVETRFSFWRNLNHQFGDNSVPSLIVSGSFNGGGAQVGSAFNDSRQFEVQENISKLHGPHTMKFGFRARNLWQDDNAPNNFGGTFLFFGVQNAPVLDANNQPLMDGSTAQISSLEQYRRTLLFQGLGYPASQIRALGGGASQFTIAGGNPFATVSQFDIGIYGMDDWRVKPNLTLSLGLRYEAQTNAGDLRNLGPRLGIAWSPKGKAGTPPKTVLRAGVGAFYNRVAPYFTLQQNRFNGVNQQQFLVTNPDFFPSVPSPATLEAQKQPGNTYRFDAGYRNINLLQSALTVEQKFGKDTTLSANYIYVRAWHLQGVVNLNAPLPGTYVFGQPSSGVRPYGAAAGNLMTYESFSNLTENVAWFVLTHKVSGRVSLTLNYQIFGADDGIDNNPSPSNPYDFREDYGRAGFVRRHNLNLIGNITLPGKIQWSPLLVMGSGSPYDLTIGSDLNGDTVANDRPAFATDLSRPSVVKTRFGNFDTNPMPGQTLVPRNYLTATGMWNLNMRVGRTFQLGKLKPVPNGAKGNGDRRYNLNFNVDINNVFNHLNQGGWVGNLSSPLFGQSTSIYLFRDTSNNRRVQFGTQFNF